MTEDDLYSEAYQEYLEAILRLEYQHETELGEPEAWITNNELATHMNVKPPSITEMIDKLSGKGLVDWKKRQGVRLTDSGRELATRLINVHYLIEEFFEVVLGLGNNEEELKHRIACVLEHHVIGEPKLKKALRDSIAKVKKKESG